MKSKYSKQDIIDEIKRVYLEFGIINRKLLKENNILNINIDFQLSKYGGLKALCKEINIPYTQNSRIDDRLLREDVLRVYREHGKISTEIYERFGNYSISAIKSHYGFNNLLKELNIEPNIQRDISQKDVIEDIQRILEIHKSVSSTVYRMYGLYSQTTIESLFGNWVNAIKAAGYAPLNEKCGYKKMESDVKKLFNEYGFISKTLINEKCDFTYEAFRNYFNSKDNISEMLGVENAFLNKDSTNAIIMYNILCELFERDDIEKEKTFEWLRNPKTKRALRIDFYISSKNIAVEYDGYQHSHYSPYFYRNDIAKFEMQIYRDKIKDDLLSEHNIKLVRFSYKDNLNKELVKERIIG